MFVGFGMKVQRTSSNALGKGEAITAFGHMIKTSPNDFIWSLTNSTHSTCCSHHLLGLLTLESKHKKGAGANEAKGRTRSMRSTGKSVGGMYAADDSPQKDPIPAQRLFILSTPGSS